MREGSPFTIYAHPRVLAILKANSIFNVLSEKNVRRQPIEIDQAFKPALPNGAPSGIEILPFAVTGKGAWYLEGNAHPAGHDGAGDTLGLRIGDKATGKYFYFLAACADVTDDLKSRLAGAPLIFFDGTVWRDDELIASGLGNKTGQGMGHIAMSGDRGASKALPASISAARYFCISTILTRRCCTAPPSARSPSAQAGKLPPMERRSCCEREYQDG